MAADPTPTTVGIIQADVRLDARQLYDEVARIKAAIEDLKTSDPSVRVGAETAGALAKIEEVQAAADGLDGTVTEHIVTTTTGFGDSASTERAVAAQAEGLAAVRDKVTRATDAQRLAEEKLWAEQNGHSGVISDSTAAEGFEPGTLRPVDMQAIDNSTMAMERQTAALEARSAAAATARAEEAAWNAERAANGDPVSIAGGAVTISPGNAEQGAFEPGTLRPIGMAESEGGALATEQLTTAKAAEARALLEDAAAAEVDGAALEGLAVKTEAAKKAANNAGGGGGGGGGGGAMGMWGMILAVIGASIPMMAGLAGYVVALGGGFAALGIAGVFAFEGIKRAMADGSALGNQYAASISLIQQGLHGVEATAATAVAPGLAATFQALSQAMPFLNQEATLFGGILGNTVATAVRTVLDGMRVLNPLFIVGARALDGFVAGIDTLATNGSLAKFGDYATQMLPVVGGLFEHLFATIGNVVGSLAPMGQVMFGLLNGVLSVVDVLTLLGPAFAPAVAGAAALWGGMALYRLITPVLQGVYDTTLKVVQAVVGWTTASEASTTATVAQATSLQALAAAEAEDAVAADTAAVATRGLGGAIDFAAGPVGWIVGGIAALVAVLATSATATGNATGAMTDYTAALQQDGGAVGDATQKMAAHALQSSGAADAGAKLGLTLNTMTAAAMGNADAQKQVATATSAAGTTVDYAERAHSRFGHTMSASQAASIQVTNAVSAQEAAIRKSITAYNQYEQAVGGVTIATGQQLAGQTALANSYGDSTSVYMQAETAQKTAAAQLAQTTANMVQQSDAAGILQQAINGLSGTNLSQAQAETAAAAATNAVTDSLAKNGTAINGNTKAAVANQQSIQGKVTADIAVAESVGKATKSTEAETKSLADSKAALEKRLKAQNELTPAIQAYIDKLYKIPPLRLTKVDIDKSAAESALRSLTGSLNTITGTPWDIQIGILTSGGSAAAAAIAGRQAQLAGGRAMGGTIPKAAFGATAGTVNGPGSALSDTAGLWHLANGEEIISNANGQADKWRPLLKAINAGTVRGLGSTTRSGPQTIKTVNLGGIHLHSPVAQDPVRAAEDASQMIVAYAGFPL
jgi:hypothetical protein